MLFNDLSALLLFPVSLNFKVSVLFFFCFVLFHFVCGALVCLTLTNQR